MIILKSMKNYAAKVIVSLRDDVKDTQGLSVDKMLKRLNIEENANFRTGKFYSFKISAQNLDSAKEKLNFICSEILSNKVVEKYEIIDLKELK